MELLLDNRLGNTPEYYFGEKDDVLMLVPDEVRKCVVFVCYKSQEGMKLGGTAFLVSMPSSEIPGRVFAHFVTAKHVIDDLKKVSVDNKVYLRMNLRDQPAQFVGTDVDEWYYHPSEQNVDVAVYPGAVPENVFDYLFVPISMAATPEIINKERIGCGDEIFLTGLFLNHFGKERNLPIVRIGNIASMPEEPIQTKTLGLIVAYLIEVRSIGGLSGSPVFVQVGGIRGNRMSPPSFFWLGLMHGHFDLPQLELGDSSIQDSLVNLKINMGIAIVIPAHKIIEVLNQEELQERRRKIDEARKLEKAPTPDVTSEP